jgi:hypothetical protein
VPEQNGGGHVLGTGSTADFGGHVLGTGTTADQLEHVSRTPETADLGTCSEPEQQLIWEGPGTSSS